MLSKSRPEIFGSDKLTEIDFCTNSGIEGQPFIAVIGYDGAATHAAWLPGVLLSYCVLTQLVNTLYIRRFGQWRRTRARRRRSAGGRG
jgi:hypothetical protein